MPCDGIQIFRLAGADGETGLGVDVVELGQAVVHNQGDGQSLGLGQIVEVHHLRFGVAPQDNLGEGRFEPRPDRTFPIPTFDGAYFQLSVVAHFNGMVEQDLDAGVCDLCRHLARPHVEVSADDDDLLDFGSHLKLTGWFVLKILKKGVGAVASPTTEHVPHRILQQTRDTVYHRLMSSSLAGFSMTLP